MNIAKTSTPRQFPTTIDKILEQLRAYIEKATADGSYLHIDLAHRLTEHHPLHLEAEQVRVADQVLVIHRDGGEIGDLTLDLYKSRNDEFAG